MASSGHQRAEWLTCADRGAALEVRDHRLVSRADAVPMTNRHNRNPSDDPDVADLAVSDRLDDVPVSAAQIETAMTRTPQLLRSVKAASNRA